jgi:hypothetical protein
MALLVASCKEDPIGQQAVDGIRPNPIISGSVQTISRPGGAYIFYKLPNNDPDISYVKGEFEINGEKKTVRSSVYKNYLAIDGLDSRLYVEIDLYVVDHSGNASEPIRTQFLTFDAPYTTLGNSIELAAGVGGISVRWKSPNALEPYYGRMGYISSNYDSDIGVVLLVADSTGKLNELAVSFSTKCSFFQPVLDTLPKLYKAFAMDKWGHYSDTVDKTLQPMYEQWLNRKLMKEYYIGDDVRTLLEPNPGHVYNYYSPMAKLFDSIVFCLNPSNTSNASSNHFMTGENIVPNGAAAAIGDPVKKPFYFTMDLGVTADVSRFWIGLPTHSDLDRFYEYANASPYDFELWGTATDFGEGSIDYVEPDKPYWTTGKWKEDPRWRYMGRYYNKRPNVPDDTPGNYSTPHPVEQTPHIDRTNEDPAWGITKRTRELGYGVRYLPDGSGPVQNDEFYYPDASVHYAITEAAVGPVRYVRWQINEVWEQSNHVRMQELWYWGGISK